MTRMPGASETGNFGDLTWPSANGGTVREDYGGWIVLEVFSPRPCPKPGVPLGRGRIAGADRPRMPPVLCLGTISPFLRDALQVECPTGSGRMMNLEEVARDLAGRLVRIFRPDENGCRPSNGSDRRFAEDPNWRNLVLFYEYFHGDTGRGLGASHQTGWTALVTRLLEDCCRRARHRKRQIQSEFNGRSLYPAVHPGG